MKLSLRKEKLIQIYRCLHTESKEKLMATAEVLEISGEVIRKKKRVRNEEPSKTFSHRGEKCMNISEIRNITEKCTACGSCGAICQKSAITFQHNEEGFVYPKVDRDSCVDCGACTLVCQISHELDSVDVRDIVICYSNSDKVRYSSSSGGVFYEIAQYVLSQEGIIYGVAFNREKQCAEYTSTERVELSLLMKSKYVEALDDYNVFLEVKENLDLGKIVLFSGTPCKVAGLKLFLRRDYKNLFTVDFKCHGRPSSKFLQDVINTEEENVNSKCVDVTFREKIKGWRKQVIKFYFENGSFQEYDSTYYYYYYFLRNYSIRKSCVDCNLYQTHQSDITLADCWEIDAKYDDDRGISSIHINTEKGQILVDNIAQSIHLIKIKFCVNNEKYAHSRIKGYTQKKRDIFYSDLRKHGIGYIKNKRYKKDIQKDKLKSFILVKLAKIKRIIRA